MTHYGGKLTKNLLRNHTVVFYPETEEEASEIQRRLFELGFKWGNDKPEEQPQIGWLDECVEKGLCMNKGAVFTEPVSETKAVAIIGTLAQLQDDYPSLIDQFNALSSEIAALRQEVSELKKEITPDENFLPFKSSGQQP